VGSCIRCRISLHQSNDLHWQWLGFDVVTTLLQCVTDPLSHEIYFDNFFTSYDLFKSLRKDNNFKAIGTVRGNRLKNCTLMDTKTMQKTDRGFYDVRCSKSVVVVKWHDNKCIPLATNFSTIEPIQKQKGGALSRSLSQRYHNQAWFINITNTWVVTTFSTASIQCIV